MRSSGFEKDQRGQCVSRVIALFCAVIYSEGTRCILLLGGILFLLIIIVFLDIKTSAL